jgi:hypothetical protein
MGEIYQMPIQIPWKNIRHREYVMVCGLPITASKVLVFLAFGGKAAYIEASWRGIDSVLQMPWAII